MVCKQILTRKNVNAHLDWGAFKTYRLKLHISRADASGCMGMRVMNADVCVCSRRGVAAGTGRVRRTRMPGGAGGSSGAENRGLVMKCCCPRETLTSVIGWWRAPAETPGICHPEKAASASLASAATVLQHAGCGIIGGEMDITQWVDRKDELLSAIWNWTTCCNSTCSLYFVSVCMRLCHLMVLQALPFCSQEFRIVF